jgi:hypothetical protein
MGESIMIMSEVLASLFLIVFSPVHAEEHMARVTTEIEAVNDMRESLVGAVQGKVTPEVFQAVCKPVGVRLQKFAKKHGYKVIQTSFKYRNLKHTPNALQTKILQKMQDDSNLLSLWWESPQGMHYFRRITVRQACLNCHGEKNKRPAFVAKKYPQDKAFGFQVGELRGIYSVLVPKK